MAEGVYKLSFNPSMIFMYLKTYERLDLNGGEREFNDSNSSFKPSSVLKL